MDVLEIDGHMMYGFDQLNFRVIISCFCELKIQIRVIIRVIILGL